MLLEGAISLQVDRLGCRGAQKNKNKFVQGVIFVVMRKVQVLRSKHIRDCLL